MRTQLCLWLFIGKSRTRPKTCHGGLKKVPIATNFGIVRSNVSPGDCGCGSKMLATRQRSVSTYKAFILCMFISYTSLAYMVLSSCRSSKVVTLVATTQTLHEEKVVLRFFDKKQRGSVQVLASSGARE